MSTQLTNAFSKFLSSLGTSDIKVIDVDDPALARELDELAKAAGYVKSVSWASVLKAARRSPDIIIDVGVRYGTPALYRAFRDVPFLLVDPQKDGEALLMKKPRSYKFVQVALGSEPGRLTLHEQAGKSTFLERTERTRTETREEYEVDVITLDALMDEHAPTGKIGLKVDVEGFEMEVFKGLSSARAERIDFIIVEASVRNRFTNGHHCTSLVSLLSQKGFRFYNIMNDVRVRPPNYYDFLFLREDDPIFN